MIFYGLSLLIVIIGSGATFVGLLWLRDKIATDKVRRNWEKVTENGRGFSLQTAGETKIQVLFDWLVSDGKYIGDAGVSYLIESGGKRILFDLGDSYGKKNPEPVWHNIKQAGHDPKTFAESLDAVVISHHHRDHVGGLGVQLKNSFKMPGGIVPKCPVYLPKSLKHKEITGRVVGKPEEILPGIGVTGPLPGWMFIMGNTPEQMILINHPEGLICVVGCGHPGAVAMARFAKEITGRPLYAFFGGAHALLDQSRTIFQRLLGAKNAPWRPSTPEDVGIMAVGLSGLGFKKIYLSTHDSDDWAVNIIRSVFEKEVTLLRVGETYEL